MSTDPTTAPTLTDEQIDQDARMTVPAGTVVHAADGTIACRYDETRGVVFGDERSFPWRVLNAPAVVLWPRDLAAVIAKARQEERDRISDLIGQEATAYHDNMCDLFTEARDCPSCENRFVDADIARKGTLDAR